ncbi:MAG: ABC transporter ATP-binding protein [Theionarchaea archaeon]|nr:ABC transporter ATP-binding protein [Theionarchaea archaeon]MBU7034439.1 ABC transporter ATP-binding protein [Theionarchaea archaeon]
MIETHDLTKEFIERGKQTSFFSPIRERKHITALDHITLRINRGEIFGLIGPNGAGKTTFCRILSTIIHPDSGHVEICGHDVVAEEDAVKKIVGIATSEYSRALYWRLTGKQNLEFFAGLYGLSKQERDSRICELFEIFGLEDWKDYPVMKYSTGMKQKLSLAKALINNPEVLLLDEPTAGLDIISKNVIKQILRENFSDKTIIWTSHDLREVEEICTRIALIDEGAIIFCGNMAEIVSKYDLRKGVLFRLDSPRSDIFSTIENANIIDGYTFEVTANELSKMLKAVSEIAIENGVEIKEIKSKIPSLEDVFMKVVNS